MEIDGVTVSSDSSPVIIAEMSGNHNRSLERALKIVDLAADAGVDLLKLQTYTPNTITLDSTSEDFVVSDPKSLWSGRTLHSLYEEAHMPWEWQIEIFRHAKSRGLPCFSSVFDASSVKFLEDLNAPAYKIASQEIVHLELIEQVAETGKPIIMSTGMASLSEIDSAVNTVVKTGSSSYALLKCTSSYPAPPEHSNLSTIPALKNIFGCEIGLSDHTLGIGVALAAIALGATIVEKHITMDEKDGGVDSAFSSNPREFELLVNESVNVYESIGKVFFGPTPADKSSMQGRRSIYVAEDILAGDKFNESNLRVVRPSFGLGPSLYQVVLGRKASINLKKGTALLWKHVT